MYIVKPVKNIKRNILFSETFHKHKFYLTLYVFGDQNLITFFIQTIPKNPPSDWTVFDIF